jgi:hypothetical protein
MFTVLQRHVSTHMSHLQSRTILVYKVTVLILGSQTLTRILHRCYLLYYNWRLLQMSLLQYYTNYSRCIFCTYVLLTQYCAGGQIEKNEMGGACGAYEGGERCVQGSGGETWGKETSGETQT